MPAPHAPAPKPTWKGLFLYPGVIALMAMAALGYSGADMAIARWAFDPSAHRWRFGEDAIWHWLFQFGPMPMIALGLGSLLLILAGLADPRLARFRKASLFIVLSLVLGAGVTANLVLKEGWGRPRPSQVDGFSIMEGTPGVPYLPPFCPAFGGDGKSFPCGHATTGFGFCALALVLWRRHRAAAIGTYAASLLYGSLIGTARILQGGHFASDVVAAALVCHLTAAVLYQVMHLYEKPEWQVRQARSRKRLAFAIGIPLVALAIAASLLATPYHEPLEISADSLAKASQNASKISIETFGTIHLDLGSEPKMKGLIKGFGLPTSRTKFALLTQNGAARFFELESGWFTELQQDLDVTLPLLKTLEVDLSAPKRNASWNIDLRSLRQPLSQTWTARSTKGSRVFIHLGTSSPVVIQRLKPGATTPAILFQGPGTERLTLTIDGPVEPDLKVDAD